MYFSSHTRPHKLSSFKSYGVKIKVLRYVTLSYITLRYVMLCTLCCYVISMTHYPIEPFGSTDHHTNSGWKTCGPTSSGHISYSAHITICLFCVYSNNSFLSSVRKIHTPYMKRTGRLFCLDHAPCLLEII